MAPARGVGFEDRPIARALAAARDAFDGQQTQTVLFTDVGPGVGRAHGGLLVLLTQ